MPKKEGGPAEPCAVRSWNAASIQLTLEQRFRIWPSEATHPSFLPPSVPGSGEARQSSYAVPEIFFQCGRSRMRSGSHGNVPGKRFIGFLSVSLDQVPRFPPETMNAAADDPPAYPPTATSRLKKPKAFPRPPPRSRPVRG